MTYNVDEFYDLVNEIGGKFSGGEESRRISEDARPFTLVRTNERPVPMLRKPARVELRR